MLICGRRLRADEKWMAETSWVHDVAGGQNDMAAISVQSFEGHGGKFKPYTPFDKKPVELFEKFI